MSQDWRPTADRRALRRRARVLQQIRHFFDQRDVLEVDTPALSAGATPDPHIDSLRTASGQFLHTSPEFPMKRLLAAGSGSIYQICKVFRDGEAGRLHNPEFTLLEWYRVGLDHHALMDEMEALFSALFEAESRAVRFERMTYREAFRRHAGLDPFEAANDELCRVARRAGIDLADPDDLERDDWLDLLMSEVVSRAFDPGALTFIHDYPASQASLARIRPGSPPVAERFELYFGALELANGFHELDDAAEQRRRFEKDLADRGEAGKERVPLDERFLEALEAGLPACAGVAVGLDRLLMALSGATSIEQVMAFPVDRA